MKNEIDDLINKLVSYPKFNMGKYLLHDTVITQSKKIVTDSIKANAELQARTGLKPKIVRRSSGSCCKWCEEIAKTYTYPNVPDDVYRRHRGCTCSVDFYPGDGKVQNVHSKEWYKDESERTKEWYEEQHKSIENDDVKEDITLKWASTGVKRKGTVSYADKYIHNNGKEYYIDGRNVILNPSEREIEVANLFKDNYGCDVKLIPRVCGKYKGVKTPDSLIDGEKWDLKGIKKIGKNGISNVLRKHKEQSNNFILDLSLLRNCSDEKLNHEINMIYLKHNTQFVDKIVIVKDYKIIKIFKRK
jgi:hypothetical protein